MSSVITKTSKRQEGRSHATSSLPILVKEAAHSLHHPPAPASTKDAVSLPLPALSLPLQSAVSPPLHPHIRVPAAHPTCQAHGLPYQADTAQPAAAHGARAEPEHSFQAWWQAQPEAGKQRGQKPARDQRQDDEGEDLERVALGVVDEIAEQALELFVGAGEEVGPRGAPVVRG